MGWRTAVFTEPCHLAIERGNLSYRPKNGEALSLPLEDICAIVIETQQATLTAPLLDSLAQQGGALFVCDKTHTPSGVFLPFHQHSRYAKTARSQIKWSAPFKKRVWQSLIKQKILNQAALLAHYGSANAQRLKNLADKVQSGDTDNKEAQAATIYWQTLFKNFSRSAIDIRNSALNYGYSIVRGAIARSVVSAGLIPAFGVHHSNELNAFNLVDDLIEPFRPIVDLLAIELIGVEPRKDRIELNKNERFKLSGVLGRYVRMRGNKIMALSAADDAAFSLVRATTTNDWNELDLPEPIFGD
ncbi:MAG: type II CRISPR-associated endonuclease Cas1 [Helicobacteraceae bacterium]|jgi:CRISPR-associated protein Cas1|nr:type II CRISPR-associated endonuclease Cas1 [Helicobacteraceae bacterium]